MKPDWGRLKRDLSPDGNRVGVRVALDDGREHSVFVADEGDGWSFSGYVAPASTVKASGLTAATLWRRNRAHNLVGYVVDVDGAAWVRGWVPRAGATNAEFAHVARVVAIEADRLEYYLTGDDKH